MPQFAVEPILHRLPNFSFSSMAFDEMHTEGGAFIKVLNCNLLCWYWKLMLWLLQTDVMHF